MNRVSINGLYKYLGFAFVRGQNFGIRLYFKEKSLSVQKHGKKNKIVVIRRDKEQTEYCEKLSMIGDDELFFIGVLMKKMNKIYAEGTYFLAWQDEFLNDDFNELYQVFDKKDTHIDELCFEQENYLLYMKLKKIFKDKYDKGDFSTKEKPDGVQLVFDLD